MLLYRAVGECGQEGDWFCLPSGLAVESVDTVFISDFGNLRIREVLPAGRNPLGFPDPRHGKNCLQQRLSKVKAHRHRRPPCNRKRDGET